MTDEKYTEYMNKMWEYAKEADDDREEAHIKADDLLCKILTELGYDGIVKIYEAFYKWYA